MASIGRDEEESAPPSPVPLMMLLVVAISNSVRPSINKTSDPVRRPLLLDDHDLPPGAVTTPGRSSSKRKKLRPFNGSATIVWLLTVPPRVEEVVLIAGASSVTVTVWVC